MQEQAYAEMRNLEDSCWWFVGKRMFIFNFIRDKPERVLDCGCGTGVMSEQLSSIGNSVVSIDNNPVALFYSKSRLPDLKAVLCNARSLSLKDHTFDLIVASDLLEHIDEDEEVLQEISRVLKRRGRLIVTVPAFRFLWSSHDKAAHHVRRYTLGQIKKKAQKAHFTVHRISYTNILVFPIVCLLRMLKRCLPSRGEPQTDFFQAPDYLNEFFILCYKLEALLLRRINFPFGVSIIGVFEKS